MSALGPRMRVPPAARICSTAVLTSATASAAELVRSKRQVVVELDDAARVARARSTTNEIIRGYAVDQLEAGAALGDLRA